jgi:hypothetical protein
VLGVGLLAEHGLEALIAARGALPGVGTDPFRAVVAACGVLELVAMLLLYRIASIGRALAVGVMGAAIGWFTAGIPQAAFAPSRTLQALAGGVALMLLALLVLGLRGGTKPPKRREEELLDHED